MNRVGRLGQVDVVDVQRWEGLDVETARLHLEDDLGRPVRLLAGRCVPSGTRLPVIVHIPGGTQTVDAADLAWWARQGFAAVSFDWELRFTAGHDPHRKSQWPGEILAPYGPTVHERLEQAMPPVAIIAAGVVIDWMNELASVDTQRVGVAGISWGGNLAWMVGAHDPRVKAIVAAFGCGGLFEPRHSHRPKAAPAVESVWMQQWDAAGFGPRMTTPVCWVTASNDFFGLHSWGHRLLDGLSAPHRRSSVANFSHHLGEGESALAAAWMKQHLAHGPAVPAEPVLMAGEWRIEADDAASVVGTERWWTPSDGPDEYRCWFEGTPDARCARQVFGKVRYASGVTLCTGLWEWDGGNPKAENRNLKQTGKAQATQQRISDERASSSTATGSDLWPSAIDGIGYYWGLSSTQFYRTAVKIEPLREQPGRAMWTVDRPAGGPWSLLFMGLADPRWNRSHESDPDFEALAICVDPLGGELEITSVVMELPIGQRNRKVIDLPFEVTEDGGAQVVTVWLEGLLNEPGSRRWRKAGRITLAGKISGNRWVVGPIRKTWCEQ